MDRFVPLNPPPFRHPLKRGKARSDDKGESQEHRRSRVASFRRGGTAMTARGGSVPLRKEATTTDLVCGNAKYRPGRVRGLDRHGGGAVAKCGRSLMSA